VSTEQRDALARLRSVKGFVFDLDGTLVLGDNLNKSVNPLPGAVELTQRLQQQGVPFVILTNGTTRTPEQYATMLRDVGFAISSDRLVLTPSAVAAEYFARRRFQRVMVLGGEGVSAPLEAAGIRVIRPAKTTERRELGTAREPVDAVFVGWYREFSIDDLEAACQAVLQGARLFTGSLAPYFATAHGKALGTSRAICAMISSLSGKRAKVLGKPSLEALRCAGRRLSIDPGELAVVGDDPALEVPMAHRGGSLAIAVHTGVGSITAFAALPPTLQPHLSLAGVSELMECALLATPFPIGTKL
jgi:HAD superfamily hydrolase (TIGR01450 family)